MRTQSIDTDPQIEKVLISIFKKENLAKKFSKIRSLSRLTMQLSKRAIARKNQMLDENQINLLFIEYNYSKELADRVREYLYKDKYENP